MFPLTEWLDRDDVTEEDLVPLTAEIEIRDWMVDTPAPRGRRPAWLPRQHWTPPVQERTHRPTTVRQHGVAWGWVAGTVVVAVLLVLSFMASAVGVVFVTLV